MEGKLEEAEQAFRRLLVLQPSNAETRVLIGELLSDRGRFEEAAREFAQAIDSVPHAFEKLTSVRRMTESDRPLMERMRVLAEERDFDVESCIVVHFGLGKAFDDLGDYAEAMRHYDAGNRLRRGPHASIARRWSHDMTA